MPDVYGPFAVSGNTWSDGEWSRYAPTWAPSGPIGPYATSATTGEWAFAQSGLSVSAAAGRAWVRGFGLTRTGTPPSHAVTANSHATWSRRDRLVLRRDLAAGTVTTAVKIGTAAASPAAPSLTQSETGVWEESLFSFLTPPASGTSITGVIDERRWVRPDGQGYVDIVTPTTPGDPANKSYVDSLKPLHMRAQRNVNTPLSTSGSWVPFASNDNWGEIDPGLLRTTGATFRAPANGWMAVTATCVFAANATGVRGLRLQPLDGQGIGEGAAQPYELVVVGASPSPHSTTITASHRFDVRPGERVQLEGYQSSGGSLTVLSVRMSATFYPA